jgi:hypothetical protein
MRENESKCYKIEVIIESEWEKERLETWLRGKFPLTNHRIVTEIQKPEGWK